MTFASDFIGEGYSDNLSSLIGDGNNDGNAIGLDCRGGGDRDADKVNDDDDDDDGGDFCRWVEMTPGFSEEKKGAKNKLLINPSDSNSWRG